MWPFNRQQSRIQALERRLEDSMHAVSLLADRLEKATLSASTLQVQECIKQQREKTDVPDGWTDADEKEFQRQYSSYARDFFNGPRISIGGGMTEPTIAGKMPPSREKVLAERL